MHTLIKNEGFFLLQKREKMSRDEMKRKNRIYVADMTVMHCRFSIFHITERGILLVVWFVYSYGCTSFCVDDREKEGKNGVH